MDIYNIDSEGRESLDFLCPPVRRDNRNSRESISPPHIQPINKNNLIRDFRTTSGKPGHQEVDGQSLTSLVLKKTTEREVVEKYSALRYTDLLPRGLRTRRHTKRVQDTISENSFQAKNVYLVVAGKKREKIYEIKTTESAKFSSTHLKDETTCLEQVSNFKQLIKSLNMDKKKKKETRNKDLRTDLGACLGTDVLGGGRCMLSECACSKADYNDRSQHPNNRVRISGQIGLNENAKYVLNCGATVDDRPIQKNFTHMQQDNTRNTHNYRCHKESDVEPEYRIDHSYGRPIICAFTSKETQFPPANYKVCFSNIDKQISNLKKDQIIQCNCGGGSENVNFTIEHERESHPPQDFKSPLVIISVYPKQHSAEKINYEKKPNKTDNNRVTTQRSNAYNVNIGQRLNSGKAKANSTFNKNEVKPRSLSPSPRPKSPVRTKTDANTVDKIFKKNNNERVNRVTNATNFVKKQHLLKNEKENKKKKTKGNTNLTTKKIEPIKKPENTKHFTEVTKADPEAMKKAIIESFTKQLTAQINSKKPTRLITPKNDVSNVTINIDEGNAFYDLLFRQGDLTTDLRVRKTLKEQDAQKNKAGNDQDSPSLENFFLESGKQGVRRRSFSQTYIFDEPPKDDLPKANTNNNNHNIPRINVRDSIEICHRREDKNNRSSLDQPGTSHSHQSPSDYNRETVPTKHYRGDSCSIPNPIQRDKEIRELLGIDKGRQTNKKDLAKKFASPFGERCLTYIYRTKCITNERISKPESICSLNKVTAKHSKNKVCCECNLIGSDTTNFGTTQISNPKKEHFSKGKNNNKSLNTNHIEISDVDQSPLYQQMILNRNINVYLQIEQFTKQKPVVLTRKQYEKVKKAIERSLNKNKYCICKKPSSVSLGHVRKKYEHPVSFCCKKHVQTDPTGPAIQTFKEKLCRHHAQPPLNNFSSNKLRKRPHKYASHYRQNFSYTNDVKEDYENYNEDVQKKQQIPDCCCKMNNDQQTNIVENRKQFVQCDEFDLDNHGSRNHANNLDEKQKHEVGYYKDTSPENLEPFTNLKEENIAKPALHWKKIRKLMQPCSSKVLPTQETERLTEENLLETAYEKASHEKMFYNKHKKASKCKQESDYCLCRPFEKIPNNKRCDCCKQYKKKFCNFCGRLLPIEPTMSYCLCCGIHESKTLVLYKAKDCKTIEKTVDNNNSPRLAASSLEVRYTSVAYMKHVTFSATNIDESVPNPYVEKLKMKNDAYTDSLHTIFKGHRKSATPNLGTSAYSLNTDYPEDEAPVPINVQESKKKPFLRRLMSCLVMHSKSSGVKIPHPQPKAASINSSIDSYHINTSLGAIDISSSLFDTSASFYSNHTILPINSKTKTGFLSSVRGFLTSRRS